MIVNLYLTLRLRLWWVSPSQHSPISSIDVVVHLHVIKLTHILSFQAEVPEVQCDYVTLLNRYIPNAQLIGNKGQGVTENHEFHITV